MLHTEPLLSVLPGQIVWLAIVAFICSVVLSFLWYRIAHYAGRQNLGSIRPRVPAYVYGAFAVLALLVALGSAIAYWYFGDDWFQRANSVGLNVVDWLHIMTVLYTVFQICTIIIIIATVLLVVVGLIQRKRQYRVQVQ